MIDSIKTLLNKTSELEDRLNNLSLKTNNNINSNNFVCFSKGLLNLSFQNTNKLLIAEFETQENFPLYFQNQVELNVPISQTINISLSINNITFFRTSRTLQAGYNQFTIMKSFVPLKNESAKLYLKITTKDGSPVTIISNTLFAWGIYNYSNEITYQVLETNNNFCLSYLNNNSLYYYITGKTDGELYSEDFTYYSSANSYSFAYQNTTDKTYLFRIDLDGNLFYTDFEENNEKFLDTNITHVSTASNDKIILISIVKNNQCYTFEMDENNNFSTQTLIDSNNILVSKSYLYHNKFNNIFYIILSDANNSNYITKTLQEIATTHNLINANYSIEFSSYEATSWN